MLPRSRAISPCEAQQSWLAELQLDFASCNGRTVLARKQHSGPLVVQKVLYPEGGAICHGIIIHPPGGIAGGDRLTLNARLNAGSHALLTTPGAGKWYKANGRQASQHVQINVQQASLLEWLPQETIVFDEACSLLDTQVTLTGDARYAGWDILCLGRQASGESFRTGSLQQHLEIKRDGRLLWNEKANLQGGDALLESPVGMNGFPVTATFLIAAGQMPVAVLEACRAISPPGTANWGVTAIPEIFAARYLGTSTIAAREYFEAIWAIARPWYAGCEAQRPRIWNT